MFAADDNDDDNVVRATSQLLTLVVDTIITEFIVWHWDEKGSKRSSPRSCGSCAKLTVSPSVLADRPPSTWTAHKHANTSVCTTVAQFDAWPNNAHQSEERTKTRNTCLLAAYVCGCVLSKNIRLSTNIAAPTNQAVKSNGNDSWLAYMDTTPRWCMPLSSPQRARVVLAVYIRREALVMTCSKGSMEKVSFHDSFQTIVSTIVFIDLSVLFGCGGGRAWLGMLA